MQDAGWARHSAGRELRDRLFDQITPVLNLSESIQEPSTRLVIQAYCLDMISTLEDVISSYELDKYPACIEC